MSGLKGLPRKFIATSDPRGYPSELVSHADLIIFEGRVVKHRHGVANVRASDAQTAACKILDVDEAKVLMGESGWRGTEPAEGTRRALILDTIERHLSVAHVPTGMALPLADEIEAALLKIDIGADPTGEVSPASTAMDVLDQLEIPRTREGAILDIGQRVTMLADKFVEGRRAAAECYRLTGADPCDGSDAMLAREALDEVRRFRKEYDEYEEAIAAVGEALDRIDAPQGATYAERIDRLYRELTGRAPGYGQHRADLLKELEELGVERAPKSKREPLPKLVEGFLSMRLSAPEGKKSKTREREFDMERLGFCKAMEKLRELIAVHGTDAIAELADVREESQLRPYNLGGFRNWML